MLSFDTTTTWHVTTTTWHVTATAWHVTATTWHVTTTADGVAPPRNNTVVSTQAQQTWLAADLAMASARRKKNPQHWHVTMIFFLPLFDPWRSWCTDASRCECSKKKAPNYLRMLGVETLGHKGNSSKRRLESETATLQSKTIFLYFRPECTGVVPGMRPFSWHLRCRARGRC
jgi:hypothetical protein